MKTAEEYAIPVHGNLGGSFVRVNDFNEKFYLRWGRIGFDVSFGVQVNLKVILRVYRDHDICETYIVDTEPYDIQWNHHKRRTRDFYIHPVSGTFGHANCVKFSFVAHVDEHSVPSRQEYIFMDGSQLREEQPQYRRITSEWATSNRYRTYEVKAWELQRDVDWYNHHF
jgi:hypothetical protein